MKNPFDPVEILPQGSVNLYPSRRTITGAVLFIIKGKNMKKDVLNLIKQGKLEEASITLYRTGQYKFITVAILDCLKASKAIRDKWQ